MFNEYTIIAFGIGENFNSYMARLSSIVKISYASDNNSNYWGKSLPGNVMCISPSDIMLFHKPLVVVLLDSPVHINEVHAQFDKSGVRCMDAREFLAQYADEEATYNRYCKDDLVVKFIDLHLDGTTVCNFACNYCSVWRKTGKGNEVIGINKSINELRKGMSRNKLGGMCYINICARGETLLGKDIVQIIRALLEEGHFVSVVTNGTIYERIKEITSFPETLQERMFFKMSFHYAELLKHNMMEIFWESISAIRKSYCSYSIEITPCDELIDEIPIIKKMFDENACGAMPHITFTRDSTKKGLDLLSVHDLDTYEEIWSTFDSKLFDLKKRWYNKKIDKYCMAGQWSYIVDANSGNIRPCYGYGQIGNIYDDEPFPSEPIGYKCKQPYCFNNHVYVAWGCQPDIRDYNYAQMRDRVDREGKHWLKDKVLYAYSQKLYENNFAEAERWEDYRRLLARKKDEKRAVILFNSPDYSNLGDHAIALATRQFFEKFFVDLPFYEVSCREYELEKSIISEKVSTNDLIVISGGGNIDSLHLRLLDMAEDVIENFSNNEIFIFPQTMYFSKDRFGQEEEERFKNIVTNHGKTHILLREKQSYELIKELFSNINVDIRLVFDMAMTLSTGIIKERRGITVCMRDDKEALKGRKEEILQILRDQEVEFTESPTVVNRKILLDNREEEVMKYIKEVASSEMVITDRLHCMIFAAITGTPCVAINNLTGKVRAVYEQIEDLPYLCFLDDVCDFDVALEKIKGIPDIRPFSEYNIISRDKIFEVAEWIKKAMIKS